MTMGILVVDARHKPTADDKTMSDYFLSTGKPFVVVANKLDKVKKSEAQDNLRRVVEVLELPETAPVIPFSAEKGDGKQQLLDLILHHVEGRNGYEVCPD